MPKANLNPPPLRTFASFVTGSEIGFALENYLRVSGCGDEHFYNTLITVRTMDDGVRIALLKD